MAKDTNGWDEYKKLILYSLDSLSKEVAILKEQHVQMKSDFTTFLVEYKANVARVKVYLTLGVALAGVISEVGLVILNHFLGI